MVDKNRGFSIQGSIPVGDGGVVSMTQKEIKDQTAAIRKMAKKVSASRRDSLAFLVKAGICTKKGKLQPVYR